MLIRFFIPFFIIIAIQLATVRSIDAQSTGEQGGGSVGLTADLNTIVVDTAGNEKVSVVRIYRLGKLVRYEPKVNNIEEVNIYDFDLLKEIRVIYSDKIFFERKINRSFLLKAERDGFYMPVNPNVTIDRIRLKEDKFDDHPAILYLVVKTLKKDGKNLIKEYSLVWEATDMNDIPIKIVYPQSDRSTVIVEYRNAKLEKLDPLLFQPPPDFLNLSPF